MIGRSQSELRSDWSGRWAASGPPGIGSTQLIAGKKMRREQKAAEKPNKTLVFFGLSCDTNWFNSPLKLLHANACRILLSIVWAASEGGWDSAYATLRRRTAPS